LEVSGHWPWKQTRPPDQPAQLPSSNLRPTSDQTESEGNG
jgi:hypothetical protein